MFICLGPEHWPNDCERQDVDQFPGSRQSPIDIAGDMTRAFFDPFVLIDYDHLDALLFNTGSTGQYGKRVGIGNRR